MARSPYSSTPPGEREDGIWIESAAIESTRYLGYVLDLIDEDRTEELTGDPFYEREEGLPPLTEEQIDRVITGIDEEFQHEMIHYRSYHLGRSGATDTPDFHRLDPRARRIVVEYLDAIQQRNPVSPITPEVPYTSDWD